MNRFSHSSNWSGAMDEFRSMVKELHKNGIEVYLDVVYNHTAEGNHTGPFLSLKGIDNRVYYMVDPKEANTSTFQEPGTLSQRQPPHGLCAHPRFAQVLGQ